MSKYYRHEDVVRAIAEQLCWEARTEYGDKFTTEDWLEEAEDYVSDLPTIEVSDEVIPIDHCIMCYEFLKERIGSEITDNAEEFEKWFERMVFHVRKSNEYESELRTVISREWAINKQREMIDLYTPHKTVEGRGQVYWQIEERKLVAKELEQAPSVVPTAKEGEWIKQYKGQVNSVCSKCGKEVGRKTPYCPNCGKKMKGAEE